MINKEERELQRECGKFVQNNIIYCQSALIEECFKKGVFCYDDVVNLYEPEQEAQEIFEWWLADKYLLERLEAKGEPVLHNEFGDWWGRTTTGQAIDLDYVIRLIYKELKSGSKDSP